MIPAACGYAGGRFIWFAGDRVRWMVDKRLNTKKASDYSEAFVCGAKGIRTPDPLHAMEMRYQLRYSPVELAGFEPATLCLQSRCATSCAIAP